MSYFLSLYKSFDEAPGDAHDPSMILSHKIDNTTGEYLLEVLYDPFPQYRRAYASGKVWAKIGDAYFDCDEPDVDNLVAVYCIRENNPALSEALVNAVSKLTKEQLSEIRIPEGGVLSQGIIDRIRESSEPILLCDRKEEDSAPEQICDKCDKDHDNPDAYERTIYSVYFQPDPDSKKGVRYLGAKCRVCVSSNVNDPSIQWKGAMKVTDKLPCYVCKYTTLNGTASACFLEAFLCKKHYEDLQISKSPDRAEGGKSLRRRQATVGRALTY